MQQADPELIAALNEPERQNTTLTRLGGKDVTSQVTAWSLDRAYDTDLPTPMRAINGSASAELRITLSGTNAQTAAQLYSPYAPHNSADIARPRQSALHSWGVADDALPSFRGSVRDRVADSGAGTLALSALDGAERLRDAARLPAAVTTGATPISSGVWIVDHLLRDAGIHTAPPPRPGCILYASMHGGLTPDIGFYRDHISNFMDYRRDRAPWEIAPSAGFAPYTARWDPRTRTTVPGRPLLAEFWVDNTDLGSAGGSVKLTMFFQADGATNDVRFIVNFADDTVKLGTDNTNKTLTLNRLFARGRWHCAVYWVFQFNGVPRGFFFLSGPNAPDPFLVEDLGNFPTMPATQLNYIELVSGLPVEAVQVSALDNAPTDKTTFEPPWQRGAVLDDVGSQLLAIPPTQGSAWEVITSVARAEQATAEFDELGVFRWRSNRRFTAPGLAIASVTSAREIASLRVSEAIDSVRNVIDVPYSTYTAGPSSTRFTDTELQWIPPFGTLKLSYDYDTSEYDSPPPIVYVATPPANTSRVRFSFQSNGGNGVHGAVESTTERDGDQMIITFRNRTGNDLFLVTSTGTPSVSIASIKLASGSPQRFSLRRYHQTSRDRYGSQVYQVPATPWLQSQSAAERVADYLLAVAAAPLPILGDVEILPDPRLQLGDLVLVVDTVGAALSTPAWIVGNKTSGDDTGRIRQVLTLRATTSPGPPVDAGLSPDPPLDPTARAVLLREGIRTP
ncbi:hypothetical protein FKR81_32525 [Lentzea tibetensis]|uniref:Uncharacterized protein n=1 Tax=Lentzea tibetensis TaxID=2591470 RepID=A0A563EKE7_9PSEU|nr:hypothetical protein [Lentzea tibetensis]TWP47438.1 hypothetical protein FKR81_32525 [Lentzea tibetensis]